MKFSFNSFAYGALIGAVIILACKTTFGSEVSQDLFFKIGGSTDYDSLATNKIVSIGLQKDLIWHFQYQLEGGYIHDNNINGGESIAFGGPSLGLAINKPDYYAKVFFGPSIVSQTDYRNSTPFEFNTDAELGLRDSRNVGIGLGFKHLSNGGLGGINVGRDFIYLKVQF